ncbi:uncharacterized protein LOC108679979 [Hyalella azteca]|uniref:Uncharacterized protein LOC108679979 n=1 Tax=Hyalella azteca TaxID=294128 RepID=A0A8B7PDJ9_HYAAZ|nr:uncharacterized protein LOC108679979 [Hyalella azteca]XP_018024214.1 uncharacterized protein LOC108679979 [Hyalella azteca]
MTGGMRCSALTTILLALVMSSLPRHTVAQEVLRECYQWTWVKDSNNTDCEANRDNGYPCFEPFIRTVPPESPPNVTDLNEVCSAKACATYTCKKNLQCLRYVRYDVLNKPLYMSLFCGTLVDVTKADTGADTKYDDCYLSKNGTVTTEACVCQFDLCNSSTTLSRPSHIQAVALALLFLLGGVRVSRY